MTEGQHCSSFGNAKCHPEIMAEEHHKHHHVDKPSKTRSAFGNAQEHEIRHDTQDKHKKEKPSHEKPSKTCSSFGNAACRAHHDKK